MKAVFGKVTLHSLLLIGVLFLQGCFPDKLDKWREPDPVPAEQTSSVLGGDGNPVNVPAPTTTESPTAFSYDQSEYDIAIGSKFSETPSFTDEPVGITNEYIFSSYQYDLITDDHFPDPTNFGLNCPSGMTARSLSNAGLELDTETGNISGSPTGYAEGGLSGTENYIIQAYHIPSGETMCTTVSFNIAHTVTFLGFEQDNLAGTKLALYLDNASAFAYDPNGSGPGVGSGEQISNADGARGVVTGKDSAENVIYVDVLSSSNSNVDYMFKPGDEIDDTSNFVTSAATISKVVYALRAGSPLTLPINPIVLPETIGSFGDLEFGSLVWSSSPDPLDPGSDASLFFDAVGSGGGSPGDFVSYPEGFNLIPQEETEYTITVRNIIGQEFTESVFFSVSFEPNGFGYSNRVLLVVNDASLFEVGRYVSTPSGSVGKILEIYDAVAPGGDTIALEVSTGEFVDGDSIDMNTVYQTEITKIIDTSNDADETIEGVFPFNFKTVLDELDPATCGAECAAGNYIADSNTSPDNIGFIEYYVSGTKEAYIRLIKGNFSQEDSIEIISGDTPDILNISGAASTSGHEIGYIEMADNIIIDVEKGADADDAGGDKVFWEAGIDVTETALTGASGIVEYLLPDSGAGTQEQDILYVNVESLNGFKAYKDVPGSGSPEIANANPYTRPFVLTGRFDLDENGDPHNIVMEGGTSAPGFRHYDQVEVGEVVYAFDNDGSGAGLEENFQGCEIATVSSNNANMTCINVSPPTVAADQEGVQLLLPQEQQVASDGDNEIENVTVDYSFVFYRGENLWLQPYIVQGQNVKYAISPDPSGNGTVSFDSSTGILSGVPTDPSSRTLYTVTASNPMGEVTTSFYMKINDQFTISNVTENAYSYHLHKSGQGNQISDCRITKDQILGANDNSKSIECFLEASELDLYQSGLSFQVDVGKGMCNYTNIAPYYFYQFPYVKTDKTIYVHSVADKCVTCDGISCDRYRASDSSVGNDVLCTSNYTTFDSTFPNCDDGKVTVVTTTWTPDGNTDECLSDDNVVTSREINCGGSPAKCINGPIKEIGLSDADLNNGKRSKSFPSIGGYSDTWEFSDPLSEGYFTNMYLANYVSENYCALDGSSQGSTPAAPVISDALFNNQLAWYNHSTKSNTDHWYDGISANNYTYRNYDPFKGANPYYIISCLDAAFDVKARIYLTVREYDRGFNPSLATNFTDPTNSSATASARFLMDNEDTDPFGSPWNDRSDWDDWIKAAEGPSGTGRALSTDDARATFQSRFGINTKDFNSCSYFDRFNNPDNLSSGSGSGDGYYFVGSVFEDSGYLIDVDGDDGNIDLITKDATTKLSKGQVLIVDHNSPDTDNAGQTDFLVVYSTSTSAETWPAGVGAPGATQLNIQLVNNLTANHNPVTDPAMNACGADGTYNDGFGNGTSPTMPAGLAVPDCSSETYLPNSIPFPLDEL